MREKAEPIWFARWEEELPSPDELMPLSQSLITPDLALAFHISAANPIPAHPPTPDFTSPNPSAPTEPVAGTGDTDEPARAAARPRLVWTPQLHKRFVEAVDHLGNKNAVPKTIMQLMSVQGLTRENVASHLQKYRIYHNRMHSLSSSAVGGSISAIDAATEQLFAGNHIPHPFLTAMPGQQPYMQVIAPPYPQHHWKMEATPASAQQQQFYHQTQLGHFLSPLDLLRPMGVSSIGTMQPQNAPSLQNFYGDDMHSGSGGGGRKVLTLFPTGIED